MNRQQHELSNPARSGSGDISFLRPYFSFHGGLSLQALQISRDNYGGESPTAFRVYHGAIARIEAPIDLDNCATTHLAHRLPK